jgi:hypothetical protein
MRIKNEIEIKPEEWLLIVLSIAVLVLLWKGDTQTAINLVTQWLNK